MANGGTAGKLVHDISIGWLGTFGGILAIIGVVAAPITTGDTALRSARLMTADILHFDQRPILKRLGMSIPLFLIAAAITVAASSPAKFEVVWRYFAWLNQTLSVFTLWAVTAYLRRHGKFYFITLIPAMFMTVVSVSFILVAPVAQGGLGLLDGAHRGWGIGLGCLVAIVFATLFYTKIKHNDDRQTNPHR
jgi:carbon starvation protein CstA